MEIGEIKEYVPDELDLRCTAVFKALEGLTLKEKHDVLEQCKDYILLDMIDYIENVKI